MNPDTQARSLPPREELMSQFVDGELPSDEANQLVLSTLDDPAARGRLKALLQLRRSLDGWRRQEAPQAARQAPIEGGHALAPLRGHGAPPRDGLRRKAGLLAAAGIVGGLLVAGGFLLAGRTQNATAPGGLAPVVVTADRMREVDSAFALHESVAGPLLWYASDDRNVEIGPTDSAVPREAPVAVILRMSWGAGGHDAALRDYVIVCRNEVPTTIDLPAAAGGAPSLRIRLIPEIVDHEVRVRYAVAMNQDAPDGSLVASLVGRRSLGLRQTALGQTAAGDKTFRFDAVAWPLGPEVN